MIRELGGEIWAECRARLRTGTPPLHSSLEAFELLNYFIDISMGVLARHNGTLIANDFDLPVEPLPPDPPLNPDPPASGRAV
jgi:hypothetical protein